MRQPDIKIAIRPDRRVLPEEVENDLFVLIEVSAETENTEVESRRLNVGFAVDRSGSMAGGRLLAVKKGLRNFIKSMREDDRIAVITYGDYIESVVRNQTAEDKQRIIEMIDPIQSGGCTAMHPGWVTAGLEVSDYYDKNCLNRVILVSDGMANIGETRADVTIEHAKKLAEKGISTSTIGVGNNFSDNVLIPMAKAGRGNAYYAKIADEFSQILYEELACMRSLVSEDVRLTIETKKASIIEVFNEVDFVNGSYQLPPLQGHQSFIFVLKIRLEKGVKNKDSIPLKILIKAKNYSDNKWRTFSQRMQIHFAEESVAKSLPNDPLVLAHYQRLLLARTNRICAKLLEQNRLQEARELLQTVISDEKKNKISGVEQEELARLQRIADQLENKEELARNRKHLKFTAMRLAKQTGSTKI